MSLIVSPFRKRPLKVAIRKIQSTPWFWLFSFASFGFLTLWTLTTPWGVGLSPDSSAYISAARGLLRGEGLVVPHGELGQMGPLYTESPFFSFLLAEVGIFGIDPLDGARILNPLFFGANLFLLGIMIFHYTHSRWAAIGGCFLTLTSMVGLQIHAMAWSEPAFIFFGLLGIFTISLFLDSESENRTLFVIASLAMGLAFFAKYSAISCVATGIAALFLFDKKPYPQKLFHIFGFGLLSSFFTFTWMLRNRLKAGQYTELGWNFEPYLGDHVRQLFGTISLWLLPKSIPAVFRAGAVIIFLLVLITAAVYLIRQKRLPIHLSAMVWLFTIAHIGVYFFSTAFMGEQSFDNRSLCLVFIAGMVYLAIAAHKLWEAKPSRFARTGILVLLIALGISNISRALPWAKGVLENGIGYSGRTWKTSELVKQVKALPAGSPIYTNGVDVLYLTTEKVGFSVPAKEDVLKVHVPDRERRLKKDYDAEMERMRTGLRESGGVLVYFRGVHWRWYYPSEKELIATTPLQVMDNFPDGAIYKMSE